MFQLSDEQRIVEIAARYGAATSEKWERRDAVSYDIDGNPKDIEYIVMRSDDDVAICADCCTPDGKPSSANAEFIAHARQDVPWLLSKLAEANDATNRYFKAGVNVVGDLHDAELRIEQLEHDLADLRENAADDAAEFRSIMAETGPDDEQHCTCVPLLRKEVKRLQGIIAETAAALSPDRPDIDLVKTAAVIKAYLAGETAGARFLQPCGHPLGCITNEPHSTTQFCQWCADKGATARLAAALRVAAQEAYQGDIVATYMEPYVVGPGKEYADKDDFLNQKIDEWLEEAKGA